MRVNKKLLGGLVAGLFVAQGAINQFGIFPIWQKNYSSHKVGVAEGLSADQLLASMAGLREMVAGILWVQADEYFDSGQFDAVLPIIRLVTWLDPRQIEVYATGSWHIGYNFTDEQNRSDRRYVPIALKLLDDGVKQNADTYRLWHEYGWMYYHKVEDRFEKTAEYFGEAVKRPDVIPALKSMVAHAALKNGDPMKAVEVFWKLQQENQKEWDATKSESMPQGDNALRIRKDVAELNLNNLILRMTARGYFAKQRGDYDSMPYETKPPVDLSFSFKIDVVQPRVLRVVGNWGIPTTGGRIRCILRDSDYNLNWDPAQSLDFDKDRDHTFMQDSLYTQNGQFDRRIDMSRNPTMYPFKANKYIMEFYFSPRNAPNHIQDKIGWNGEGMTDKNFINTEMRAPARVLYAKVELDRDMIMRRGKYRNGYTFRSVGFKEITTRDVDDVITRGGG
ncbi:MAG: hypothetical protein U0R49_06285 [Fimbriimonadales bacterium]